MGANELKKLNRTELLELLLEVTKENERLKRRIKIYEEVVQDKKIAIEESGSLAEAAVKISGVLEAAQEAAIKARKDAEARFHVYSEDSGTEGGSE